MSMFPKGLNPVPPITSQVAKAAFPKGNLYLTLRDEIGTFYQDQDFEKLFSIEGHPAISPWRLALICVMQYIEGLSDRQAAEAVRSRIDWKYALGLELTDSGFDFSVLSEFRQRLITGGYDPDARYGNKRSITWTGYKVHLTETCDRNEVHLITNVETTQAHFSDTDQTEPIHQSLKQKNLLPFEHIVDAGYVDATLLVTSHKQYDVVLVGPVRPNSSWQSKIPGGYDISQFKVNWNTKRVTCPMGKKSTKNWTTYRDKWDNPAIRVGFPRKTCQLCPNRSLCTQSVSEPRRLTLRPQKEHELLQSLRIQQDTPEWKEHYNRRAGVEGTISQGVRAFGLRKARYLGLAKVHLQHLLTAAAINVVRMVAWLQGVPISQTRTSRFAALAPH
jgi:transposase